MRSRTIGGFDHYRVFEDGRIWSDVIKAERVACWNNRGYAYVDLWNHGLHKKFLVHRLVAKAFVPNPEGKPAVNHIDGNHKNNHFTNLEWCTIKENNQHAFRNGAMNNAIGRKRRFTWEEAEWIRFAVSSGRVTQKEISETMGVGQSLISQIITRHTYKQPV